MWSWRFFSSKCLSESNLSFVTALSHQKRHKVKLFFSFGYGPFQFVFTFLQPADFFFFQLNYLLHFLHFCCWLWKGTFLNIWSLHLLSLRGSWISYYISSIFLFEKFRQTAAACNMSADAWLRLERQQLILPIFYIIAKNLEPCNISWLSAVCW